MNKENSTAAHGADTLIRLSDVSMAYDKRLVLEGVNLSINRGDLLAITGPNGGGKTTLLRIILRLLKPTHGQVAYYNNGVATGRLPIGYLPQKNMIDSRFPITVREVIASGLPPSAGLSKSQANLRVEEILREVDLSSHASMAIGSLSGGQLQRALFGRALISRPGILVLDEPLSYIDKRFEAHLYELIDRLSRSATILLVSHEMSVFSDLATRHIIVDRSIHECTAHHHYVAPGCN